MPEQTILIVEDDPDIRDGVRILLAGEGYRILEAENGAKALQVFSPEVDLVILDVMMPGMSGLRVCEELRKKSTVPILFLTAKAQESDKLVGLTAGGDDYLGKPFSFAELSARVRALLRRYTVYRGKGEAGAAPERRMLCAHGVNKYHSQAQLEEYLGKIDAKARQIKQLSDNLFEYALVTRDTVVALDGPAPFSQIFEEPLAEFADQLDQRGFGCLLDLGEEDVRLQVYRPYIRRIFDNIASNIFKYADPAHPILVSFVREGAKAGLAFANVPLPPDTGGAESTKVGLISVQTMMEKMQAEVEVSQTARRYCITLLFPVKQI